MHVARVYLRVSTQGAGSIIAEARDAGYYIAGVYREKASGARADRPELLRLIADLQPGEVVVAEKIDRISRLPLPEAEKLIETIRNKGARLAVPGVVDLSDIAASADGVAKIVLESIQEMLLKLALQMARDDFEDRRERQRQGIELAKAGGKHAGRQADLVSKPCSQATALTSGRACRPQPHRERSEIAQLGPRSFRAARAARVRSEVCLRSFSASAA
ncbi:MAG: resolvase [Mesorhizobium sp.]|uniref:recombinase family protein n=1 Tax=Mesorhizobium sp. TaxID=1871066 RepID=UPI00122835D8|nr:MAG: resolvase [Mesorhizobium sp.]